jgi:hypothetical protein
MSSKPKVTKPRVTKKQEGESSPDETEQKQVRQRVRKPAEPVIGKNDLIRSRLSIMIERLSCVEDAEACDDKSLRREVAFCLKHMREISEML